MTEKRFVYNVHKNCIETSNGEFVVYVNSVDGVRIANKFNVLLKENEQLKFDFKEFKSLLHSLEEENERLREQITDWETSYELLKEQIKELKK